MRARIASKMLRYAHLPSHPIQAAGSNSAFFLTVPGVHALVKSARDRPL
jgi:hypothetical protein